MSWDKLIEETDREFMANKRMKGNDKMDLKKMTIEELKGLSEQVNSMIQYREEMEVREVFNEFLDVWEKMEKMGMRIECDDIRNIHNGTGKKLKDVNLELDGKTILICE